MKMMINFVLGVFLLGSLTGCATLMSGGKSATRFNADVAKIHDAALAVLKDEQLPVVRKTLSRDMAQIDSEYSDGSPIHIIARATSRQYADVVVSTGSSGDNYRAYELMKKLEDRVK